MTNEEKKLLDTFETKVRHLLFLHEEEHHKAAQLTALLSEREEEIRSLKAENSELQRQYSNLKSALTISLDGGDVRETQKRLSKLVREVDKCIALLNQ